MTDPWVRDRQALAATPLFAGASKRELEAASRLGTFVSVPAGQRLSRIGQYPAQLAIVIEGEAVTWPLAGPSRTLQPGDWFGELGSHRARRPGLRSVCESAAVVATRASVLFVIGPREIAGLCWACPRVAERLDDDGADIAFYDRQPARARVAFGSRAAPRIASRA